MGSSSAPDYPSTTVSSNGLFGTVNTNQYGQTYQASPFEQQLASFSSQNALPYLQEYLNPNYDSAAFHQSDDYYKNKMYNQLQNEYLNPGLENNLLRGSTAEDIYRGFGTDLANTEYQRQQDYKNQQLAAYQAAMLPYQTAFSNYATNMGLGNSLNNSIANYNMNKWQNEQAQGAGVGSLIGNSIGAIGGIALAPFTGETSLLGTASSLGNMFGNLGNKANTFRDFAKNSFDSAYSAFKGGL